MLSLLPGSSVTVAFLLLSGFLSGCAVDAQTGEAQGALTASDQELLRQCPPPAKPGFEILKPKGKYFGKRYEDWGSEWWRWALETPASTHPIIDETGEFCGVNQTEPLFFLAGDFGGSVARDCTVPRSKPVFFPLLNFFWDNCGVPPDEQTPNSEIIDELENFSDSVTTLTLKVDGVTIGSDPDDFTRYLGGVTKFSYVVPEEDSLYEYIGFDFAGRCAPSFQTGYYVLISFERGKHEIEFSGTQADFSLDVKYTLTVK